MAFLSDVDYNYLQSVLLWMIIIFDMDTDEKYGRLCLYLTLIMCNFVLQVVPTIHICLNYLTFNLFLKYLLFRFRESTRRRRERRTSMMHQRRIRIVKGKTRL